MISPQTAALKNGVAPASCSHVARCPFRISVVGLYSKIRIRAVVQKHFYEAECEILIRHWYRAGFQIAVQIHSFRIVPADCPVERGSAVRLRCIDVYLQCQQGSYTLLVFLHHSVRQVTADEMKSAGHQELRVHFHRGSSVHAAFRCPPLYVDGQHVTEDPSCLIHVRFGFNARRVLLRLFRNQCARRS